MEGGLEEVAGRFFGECLVLVLLSIKRNITKIDKRCEPELNVEGARHK